MSKIEALGDYVVIKTEIVRPQETTHGLLTGNVQRDIIVAVGVDVTKLKVGDTVICSHHIDNTYHADGTVYTAVHEKDVIARIA